MSTDLNPAMAPSNLAGAADSGRSRVGVNFVFETCAKVQRVKCLTAEDEWRRECFTIDLAESLHASSRC